jgi:RNA polymerase sigma-32 factor
MGSLDRDFQASPEQNLSRYLQDIRKYPMLEASEETALARRWRKNEDPEAARQIVSSHLRLVAKIAMGFRGYGLPVGDLISEGNVGMMQAIRRFDPERGFRFSTYAMWWIKASIQEYVLRSWSLVKMGTTAAQKKLFFNLRKLKSQIDAMEEGDLLPENVTIIANHLKVSETEVIAMNRRLSIPDQSLNAPMHDEGDGEWIDRLVENGDNQEAVLGQKEEFSSRHSLLCGAMGHLSEREQHIITERRLKDQPTTLQHLSSQYGISRERIRQIEVRAFEKLQKSVKNAAINHHLSI